MINKNTKQLLVFIIRYLFFFTIALVVSIFLPLKFFTFQLTSIFILIILHVEGSRIIARKIYTRLPPGKQGYKHILLQIPVITLYSYFLLIAFNFLFLKVFHLVDQIRYVQGVFVSGLFSFGTTTVYEGIEFFKQWRAFIIRSERIEKANLVAKYETLKKQIHPHFLFNGLNTLIGLIESGDKKAAVYAQNMSDFLKYLLTHQQKETISLADEINIVKQYAFIQQVRFNENLKVIIDVDGSLEIKTIPPLALQMLVENAIKHNIISSKYPLTISIKNIGAQVIQIENIVKKKHHVKSASFGLKNLFERYEHLKADKPVIEELDNKFIVKLPLI